jgi:hypothetical protein
MKNFATDSTGYLLKFARASKGQPFSAEDVTDAATAAGIALRATAYIYRYTRRFKAKTGVWP